MGIVEPPSFLFVAGALSIGFRNPPHGKRAGRRLSGALTTDGVPESVANRRLTAPSPVAITPGNVATPLIASSSTSPESRAVPLATVALMRVVALLILRPAASRISTCHAGAIAVPELALVGAVMMASCLGCCADVTFAVTGGSVL